MSIMFFSVDVETSSTDPDTGDLLTIGAVAVREDGIIVSTWYERILHTSIRWDDETLAWWKEQNAAAKREIFSTSLVRHSPSIIARAFAAWVDDQTHLVTDPAAGRPEAVFVANPVSFDHEWMRRLCHDSDTHWPFHYRTMCLRSVAWGRHGGSWGDKVRTHPSRIPHHALHDAHAQALDLIELLP